MSNTKKTIITIICGLSLSDNFAQAFDLGPQEPSTPEERPAPPQFETPIPAYLSSAQLQDQRTLRRVYPDIQPSYASQESEESEASGGRFLLRHTQASQKYTETSANCTEEEVDAYWNFLADVAGLYRGESIEDMYNYNNGDELGNITFSYTDFSPVPLNDENIVAKPDCLNPYPFNEIYMYGGENTHFDFLKGNTTVKNIYMDGNNTTDIDFSGLNDIEALRSVYISFQHAVDISLFNQPGLAVDDMYYNGEGEPPSFSDHNVGMMIALGGNKVERIHAFEHFNDNRYTYPIASFDIRYSPELILLEGFNKVRKINSFFIKRLNPELVITGFQNLDEIRKLSLEEVSINSFSSVIQGVNITSDIVLSDLLDDNIDFNMFNRVISMAGTLELRSLNADSIDGFTGLDRVDEIWISDTPLTDITGMRPSIVNDVVISNTRLTNLDFLENVTSIDGTDVIDHGGMPLGRGTMITNNPYLTDISGLRNIASTTLPIFIDYTSATAANYTNRPTLSSPFCQGILDGNVKIADYSTYGNEYWSTNYSQTHNTSLLVSRLCESD